MTYSIVARDPTTRALGVAVQSRYFAAGRHVPWIEAGVGVVASQAFASPVYGHEGLRLLRSGLEPRAVQHDGARHGVGRHGVCAHQRANRAVLLRFADAGLIPIPRARLEPLVTGLG